MFKPYLLSHKKIVKQIDLKKSSNKCFKTWSIPHNKTSIQNKHLNYILNLKRKQKIRGFRNQLLELRICDETIRIQISFRKHTIKYFSTVLFA